MQHKIIVNNITFVSFNTICNKRSAQITINVKDRKFSKSIQSMYKVAGVLVDTTVCQQRDDDNIIQDIHFPVYEYEWQGEKKRLYSTTNALHIKIGRPVHILIDSQTEEAICLEEQKSSDSMLLIFGVIGLLTLTLMILLGTGILS